MEGWIFDIQRFSIHDGPGIRTTVFLQGCPMRCPWCHNPEGLAVGAVLSFAAARCIGCGLCFRTCPRQVHRQEEGSRVLDRARCRVCGACAEACPPGALEVVGRRMTVEAVLAEVLADKAFYDTSGGGMTLSGGEPLLQIDFAEALLRGAKGRGLHTAIETCGAVPPESLRRVTGLVDLFLYDIKEADESRHRAATGVEARRVVENLRRLHDGGAAILVRVPVVPPWNDSEATLAALCRLLADLPRLQGLELMPYHRLGEGKWQRLGMTPREPLGAPPSAELLARWAAALREAGVKVVNSL